MTSPVLNETEFSAKVGAEVAERCLNSIRHVGPLRSNEGVYTGTIRYDCTFIVGPTETPEEATAVFWKGVRESLIGPHAPDDAGLVLFVKHRLLPPELSVSTGLSSGWYAEGIWRGREPMPQR